jgi:hypothetical protein
MEHVFWEPFRFAISSTNRRVWWDSKKCPQYDSEFRRVVLVLWLLNAASHLFAAIQQLAAAALSERAQEGRYYVFDTNLINVRETSVTTHCPFHREYRPNAEETLAQLSYL